MNRYIYGRELVHHHYMKSAPQIGTICIRKLPKIFKLFLSSLLLPYLLSGNARMCAINYNSPLVF